MCDECITFFRRPSLIKVCEKLFKVGLIDNDHEEGWEIILTECEDAPDSLCIAVNIDGIYERFDIYVREFRLRLDEKQTLANKIAEYYKKLDEALKFVNSHMGARE